MVSCSLDHLDAFMRFSFIRAQISCWQEPERKQGITNWLAYQRRRLMLKKSPWAWAPFKTSASMPGFGKRRTLAANRLSSFQ
jgi:hypothetical protein